MSYPHPSIDASTTFDYSMEVRNNRRHPTLGWVYELGLKGGR